MRIWTLVVLVFLAVASAGLLGGGPEPQFSQRLQDELDGLARSRMAELQVPSLAIGLWVPGVGSFVRTYGQSDAATGRPRTLADHQRIGSITKTFTTGLILQLADEGRLSVDDSLATYLSTDGRAGTIRVARLPANADRITLRDLGSMTSGIASYTFVPSVVDAIFSEPDRSWPPLQLAELGLAETLAGCPNEPRACFAPGTSFFYSNTNTVLLGMIAELVSGQSFETLLRQRITSPLGLANTAVSQSQLPSPFARGVTTQGSSGAARVDATNWNPSWGFTAGNMESTLEDLRTWGRVLGRGEGLSPASRAVRFTRLTVGGNDPATMAYAFGIGYMNGWWGHTGELPGYNATVHYRPDVDAVLVVMAASDDGNPAAVIARDIIATAAREAPLGSLDPSRYPSAPRR